MIYDAEGRVQLCGAMSALVDLPGVANPLEDDYWLLEECASGLVMVGSRKIRTDGVASLQLIELIDFRLRWRTLCFLSNRNFQLTCFENK